MRKNTVHVTSAGIRNDETFKKESYFPLKDMVKRTGPTSTPLRLLITELSKDKTPFWQRVSYELNRSERRRREVNLSSINRNSESGETVIVPGKVLGSGELKHKVTIAALKFTAGAVKKIKEAGAEHMTLKELHAKKKTGRILG